MGRFWLQVLASATDLAGFARLLSLQVEQWTSLPQKGSYASQLVDEEGKTYSGRFPIVDAVEGEKAHRIEVPKTGEDWLSMRSGIFGETAEDLVRVGGLHLGPSAEEFLSQVRDAELAVSGEKSRHNRRDLLANFRGLVF